MPTSLRAKSKTALVEDVVRRLEEVYGETPYAARFDPTEELVSCILSQHTSDANSFPAFYRLREKYKTWPELIQAGQEDVADVIRSAGLANQKSKSIIRCLVEVENKT